MAQKFFNVAGPCIPEEHYMLPPEDRCDDLLSLVEQRLYFVIHAPRQVGKTTLIQSFVRELNDSERYLALYCSLEMVQGIDDPDRGIAVILSMLARAVKRNAEARRFPFEPNPDTFSHTALSEALESYCMKLDKPLVIMFDEVDCLGGATLISFLRQLREGYVSRGDTPFVHALALVGMRNIRDFKRSIRGEEKTLGGASPFNIITQSLTIRNFTRAETGRLLGQHTEATGQVFPEAVVDKLFDWTQGQPWLVNAVAREMTVSLLKRDASKPLTEPLVDQAVENIILRRDTHIDSLLERLKEPRVRRVVEPVILGKRVDLDFVSDDATYVFDLGLLTRARGNVAPANPIYGEVIIRLLTLNSQYHLDESWIGRFIENGVLDMQALLKAFQQFWRENSDIWVEKYQYREAAPHLILLAFLQRIINGGGSIQREYSAGRGRIDLCISLGEFRYALELKIRYGPDTRQKGLEKTSDYLDTLALSEGWLIIFDRNPDKPWDEKITWETVDHEGKRIHVVGC